jgi:hypothetical protein
LAIVAFVVLITELAVSSLVDAPAAMGAATMKATMVRVSEVRCGR